MSMFTCNGHTCNRPHICDCLSVQATRIVSVSERSEQCLPSVKTRAFETIRRDPGSLFPSATVLRAQAPIVTDLGTVYDPKMNTVHSKITGESVNVVSAIPAAYTELAMMRPYAELRSPTMIHTKQSPLRSPPAGSSPQYRFVPPLAVPTVAPQSHYNFMSSPRGYENRPLSYSLSPPVSARGISRSPVEGGVSVSQSPFAPAYTYKPVSGFSSFSVSSTHAPLNPAQMYAAQVRSHPFGFVRHVPTETQTMSAASQSLQAKTAETTSTK